MTLTERFNCWRQLAERLQSTNSIVEKRMILKQAPEEMNDDIQYIFEILAGQHKFGFTYYHQCVSEVVPDVVNNMTIKEYLSQLEYCNFVQSWSIEAVAHACNKCRWFDYIVEPIVNRTLKLGIGKSVLPKDGLGAMLGKSYEGQPLTGPVFVTEKLDGNRCIARFDGMKWNFTSRNGKPMKVQFDMTGLPTEFIYDGEILSRSQTEASIKLANGVREVQEPSFNTTSGLINSKYGDKSNLVYNIFDIMVDDIKYHERRDMLNMIKADNVGIQRNWRILPVLAYCTPGNDYLHELLDDVTSVGAEGLMLNTSDGYYTHKRTNELLKYKKVKTMDLKVVDIKEGTGKYEGMVGALECIGKFDDKIVTCQVGSGLSDEQRELWSLNPQAILGKIVEIAYFSESQNKDTSGSMYYSLRFPRLKQVRIDKVEVSKW